MKSFAFRYNTWLFDSVIRRVRLKSPSQLAHRSLQLYSHIVLGEPVNQQPSAEREREKDRKPIKIATRVSARASVRLSMNQCASDLLFLYYLVHRIFSTMNLQRNKRPNTNNRFTSIEAVLLVCCRCFDLLSVCDFKSPGNCSRVFCGMRESNATSQWEREKKKRASISQCDALCMQTGFSIWFCRSVFSVLHVFRHFHGYVHSSLKVFAFRRVCINSQWNSMVVVVASAVAARWHHQQHTFIDSVLKVHITQTLCSQQRQIQSQSFDFSSSCSRSLLLSLAAIKKETQLFRSTEEKKTHKTIDEQWREKQHIEVEREGVRDDILLRFLTSQMLWFPLSRNAQWLAFNSKYTKHTRWNPIRAKPINRLQSILSTMQTTSYVYTVHCKHTLCECAVIVSHLILAWCSVSKFFAACTTIKSIFTVMIRLCTSLLL